MAGGHGNGEGLFGSALSFPDSCTSFFSKFCLLHSKNVQHKNCWGQFTLQFPLHTLSLIHPVSYSNIDLNLAVYLGFSLNFSEPEFCSPLISKIVY